MSILLQDLVKRFDGTPVVDRVSLEIADGELFVLLGPSGSGKSTILRMIAGLTHVDEGRVLLQDRDVTDLPPQARQTGFVFQNYVLFEHMTVAENVEFGLAVRKRPKAERASRRDDLLSLVGLAGFAGRYPRQLSGGQQQRVALARALAFEPQVLLLDEPLGALDVQIRAQLRRSLHEIQRALKVTTILVTHDQEEAFELADRIGVIARGRLLEVGAPPELYRRPRHEFVAGFVGEANLLAVRPRDGRLRVGELELALPADPGSPSFAVPRAEWAILFRPEQLSVAADRPDLRGSVLGQGIVKEFLDLGSQQRVRVQLDSSPDVWPLGKEYGEPGIPLRVSLREDSPKGPPVAAGDRVWVSSSGDHILRRALRRFLIAAGEGRPPGETERFASMIAEAMGAETLLLDTARSERAEIDRELAREAYDLVATGPESYPALRDLPASLLVVRGERPALRRVLLCTAAGEPGKLDIFLGAEIARCSGAQATLLYVQDPSAAEAAGEQSAAPRTRSWIERHLERGAETLRSQGVVARVQIRYGRASVEIPSESRTGDYDLVVIGGHLRRTYFRQPERDLASELVAAADRPVLVVKSGFER